MQNIIPLKLGAKPVQQKIRKMHLVLEPTMKKEMDKLMVVRIIVPIRHTEWVANRVPVTKTSDDIKLCIDFRNISKALEKDNYHVSPMEHILQEVLGSKMLSLLDGF